MAHLEPYWDSDEEWHPPPYWEEVNFWLTPIQTMENLMFIQDLVDINDRAAQNRWLKNDCPRELYLACKKQRRKEKAAKQKEKEEEERKAKRVKVKEEPTESEVKVKEEPSESESESPDWGEIRAGLMNAKEEQIDGE